MISLCCDLQFELRLLQMFLSRFALRRATVMLCCYAWFLAAAYCPLGTLLQVFWLSIYPLDLWICKVSRFGMCLPGAPGGCCKIEQPSDQPITSADMCGAAGLCCSQQQIPGSAQSPRAPVTCCPVVLFAMGNQQKKKGRVGGGSGQQSHRNKARKIRASTSDWTCVRIVHWSGASALSVFFLSLCALQGFSV